jgi:hypothetical protein
MEGVGCSLRFPEDCLHPMILVCDLPVSVFYSSDVIVSVTAGLHHYNESGGFISGKKANETTFHDLNSLLW